MSKCWSGLFIATFVAACGGPQELEEDPREVLEEDQTLVAASAGLPLPIYRVGQRGSYGISSQSQTLLGTLVLPESVWPGELTNWTLRSGAGTAPVTFSNVRKNGQKKWADFQTTVRVRELAPGAREVFHLRSGNSRQVFSTVRSDNGQLTFTEQSTALQVLGRAGVRESNHPLFEVYASGLRPGDNMAFDLAVPNVAQAIIGYLASTGSTGLSEDGIAWVGTPVFSAVDQALVGTSVVKAPRITAPATAKHLGFAEVSGTGGQLAFSPNGQIPLVHAPLLVGPTRVGFFFYSSPTNHNVVYTARVRLADGKQSPASKPFTVSATRPSVPSPPQLIAETDNVRACGGQAGNWILFLQSSSEIAVGFAAKKVPDDGTCVRILKSELPAEHMLLGAHQITPDFRVSAPDVIAF